jgi:hypothetical protein
MTILAVMLPRTAGRNSLDSCGIGLTTFSGYDTAVQEKEQVNKLPTFRLLCAILSLMISSHSIGFHHALTTLLPVWYENCIKKLVWNQNNLFMVWDIWLVVPLENGIWEREFFWGFCYNNSIA